MKTKTILLLWLLIYALLLGSTLNNTRPYQGDESIYITSAIRMIESDNYLVPEYFGNMRFNKPILPYWVTVTGYKLFGIHLWSGRAVFLLTACTTLLLIYHFSKLLVMGSEFALLNMFLLSSSTLFFEFSRVSMTDLLLTCFMTSSLFFFHRALADRARIKSNYFFAFGSMGCAFISKGFLGILPLVGMLFFLLLKRPENYRRYLLNLVHPANVLVFLLFVLPWYLFVYLNYYKLASSQLSSESSQLMPEAGSVVRNIFFYAKILVTNYFPVTIVVCITFLRKRIRFPSGFGLPLTYMITAIVFISLFMELHKARYLLIIFPTLTLFAGYILYHKGMAVLMRNISIGVLCLHIVFFQFYSLISGEPVKELVESWRQEGSGDLALVEMDNKRTSWAQALSNGRLKEYYDDIPFIIIPEKELDTFTDYEIIAQRGRIKTISFENFSLRKEMRNFYLLKRIE